MKVTPNHPIFYKAEALYIIKKASESDKFVYSSGLRMSTRDQVRIGIKILKHAKELPTAEAIKQRLQELHEKGFLQVSLSLYYGKSKKVIYDLTPQGEEFLNEYKKLVEQRYSRTIDDLEEVGDVTKYMNKTGTGFKL